MRLFRPAFAATKVRVYPAICYQAALAPERVLFVPELLAPSRVSTTVQTGNRAVPTVPISCAGKSAMELVPYD